nr:CST complex subunit STN1 [Ipomoea batatas]
MDAPASLLRIHVKLLAFDLLALVPNPVDHTSFSRNGVRVCRAEVMDVVVSREYKPGRFLKFAIDHTTGCISCVLWLNHLSSPYFSRRSPPDVRAIAEMAAKSASEIQLGVLARVRGKRSGSIVGSWQGT